MERVLSRNQLLFGIIVGVGIFLGMIQLVDYPWAIDQMVVTFLMTIWLFCGGIHTKGMAERGELDPWLTWMWAPGLVLVLLLDVLFNLVWGTIIFREWPHYTSKEVLFSSRVQRHVDVYVSGLHSTRREVKAALTWATRLNRMDKGHIRGVPENMAEILAGM